MLSAREESRAEGGTWVCTSGGTEAGTVDADVEVVAEVSGVFNEGGLLRGGVLMEEGTELVTGFERGWRLKQRLWNLGQGLWNLRQGLKRLKQRLKN